MAETCYCSQPIGSCLPLLRTTLAPSFSMQYLLLNNFAGPLGVLLASILYPHPQSVFMQTVGFWPPESWPEWTFLHRLLIVRLPPFFYAQRNILRITLCMTCRFFGCFIGNRPVFTAKYGVFVRIRSALRRQLSSTCASLLPVKKNEKEEGSERFGKMDTVRS